MAPPLQHSAPTLPPRTAITNRLRERLPPRTNYAGTSRITRVQDSGSRPLDTAPEIQAGHPRQTIIGDKNYYGREFEHDLTERHLTLLRPARKGEPERAGAHLFKPLRQVIESINQTLKGQLDLEPHGGKTPAGGTARVLVRILALTAAVWHNDKTEQPVKRSLTAYDH